MRFYGPDNWTWAQVVRYVHYLRRPRRGSAGFPTAYRRIARDLNAALIETRTGVVGRWTGIQVARLLASTRPEGPIRRQRKRHLAPDEYLSGPDCRALRDAAGWYRPEIECLLGSGLRNAELCELRVADLVFSGRRATIRVRRGKGSKMRAIRIDGRLKKTLVNHTAGRSRAELVFSNRHGRPWRPRALWGMVRRVGQRAGIDGLYPHVLRHTFATVLRDSKADVFFIAEQLGHSRIETVEIYARTLETQIQGVLAEFDRRLYDPQR